MAFHRRQRSHRLAGSGRLWCHRGAGSHGAVSDASEKPPRAPPVPGQHGTAGRHPQWAVSPSTACSSGSWGVPPIAEVGGAPQGVGWSRQAFPARSAAEWH